MDIVQILFNSFIAGTVWAMHREQTRQMERYFDIKTVLCKIKILLECAKKIRTNLG